MLACHDLRVEVGGRALLDSVELEVEPRRVVAVVGENGAGKSTLTHLLAGDPPGAGMRVSGEVTLNGQAIRAWSPLQRARQRAVLPQHPEAAFAFTALELAALGRFAHGGAASERTAIARAALDLADAAHLESRDVTTLSGGERARVHMAAVFAQLWEPASEQPRYLLLDEPTASLDLSHQHAILAATRAFAQSRGIGVLMVVHDLNLAAQYADRVTLLKRGRILAAGEPAAVLRPTTIEEGFAVAACVLSHPITRSSLVATAARRVGHGTAVQPQAVGRVDEDDGIDTHPAFQSMGEPEVALRLERDETSRR